MRVSGLNLARYNCNCGIVTRTPLICHLALFLGSITPSSSSQWEFNFLCPSQALLGVHGAKLRSFLLLFTNFLSGRLIYRQEWRKKHFINISLRKCVGLQVILLNSTFQVSKGSRAGKCRCKISRKMLMNQIISQLSKKSPQLKLATCSSCGCKAGVWRRVGSRGWSNYLFCCWPILAKHVLEHVYM